MPALITGAHPAARPRLVLDGPGREGRADYERRGGYRAGLEGQDLVTAVTEAELRGRGGAAFPLGVKLAAVAGRPGEHVVVANGEEGEPASVKDRWLLRTRPHLVIDGALRAASAVAADTVYLYVSDPAAARSVRAARAELGELPARVEVWEVDPGYVAGEESALVHWVNGGDAKPTFVPPRPFERGVRGRPTLVSNVETLANLPGIATGADRHGHLPDDPRRRVPGSGLFEVPSAHWRGRRVLGGLGGHRGYLMGGYFAARSTSGAALPPGLRRHGAAEAADWAAGR
jgi:NADH:ubiquinone oxidoreductase subunit F (NADH-binding)